MEFSKLYAFNDQIVYNRTKHESHENNRITKSFITNNNNNKYNNKITIISDNLTIFCTLIEITTIV